jgi:hypothetical protein
LQRATFFASANPVRRRLVNRAWQLALVLTGFCLWTGSAGSGPAPADTSSVPGDNASSFDDIQRTIFNVSCISGPCHSSTSQQGNLVLEEGVSYSRLVGVAPFNSAARAAGLQRVVPGDADNSLLLIKLTGPPAAEGSRMPLGFAALSPTDIQKIRSWILAGAVGPGGPPPTFSATSPPSATPTATPTATNTVPPTLTAPPSQTPSGTRPATPTATTTPTQTATVTPTPSPSAVPTPTFSLDSTFPQIQAAIFNTTCLDLGCHNATDRAGDQSLAPADAYAQLVGVTPFVPAAAQAGFLRVTPGDPDKSFLITKLTMTALFDPQFGSRMPLSKPQLTADQIAHIRAWILRGALADETP